MKLPARRFPPVRRRNRTPASSCATTTGSSLRMSISRMSWGGDRRRSCSPKMRHEGSRAISPSCRSYCASRKLRARFAGGNTIANIQARSVDNSCSACEMSQTTWYHCQAGIVREGAMRLPDYIAISTLIILMMWGVASLRGKFKL